MISKKGMHLLCKGIALTPSILVEWLLVVRVTFFKNSFIFVIGYLNKLVMYISIEFLLMYGSNLVTFASQCFHGYSGTLKFRTKVTRLNQNAGSSGHPCW